MKKRNLIAVLLSGLLIFGLASCGSDAGENKSLSPDEIRYSDGTTPEEERKIIYTVNYYITSDELEEDTSKVKGYIKDFGGYITNSNEYSNDEGRYSSATYQCCIPTAKLDQFLEKIDKNLVVSSKSINSDDVTNSYVSAETKIETLKNVREGYENALKEANDINTILAIQDKITQIEQEIAYYEAIVKRIDTQTEYTVVSIYFNQKYKEPSFFSTYFEYVGQVFVVIFKIIMYTLPFALIGGAIATAIVIPIAVKNRKNKGAVKK